VFPFTLTLLLKNNLLKLNLDKMFSVELSDGKAMPYPWDIRLSETDQMPV